MSFTAQAVKLPRRGGPVAGGRQHRATTSPTRTSSAGFRPLLVSTCSATVTVPTPRPAWLGALRVRLRMKLIRTAVVVGMAKRLYDESRKPENQRRIRSAVEQVRAHRARPRR